MDERGPPPARELPSPQGPHDCSYISRVVDPHGSDETSEVGGVESCPEVIAPKKRSQRRTHPELPGTQHDLNARRRLVGSNKVAPCSGAYEASTLVARDEESPLLRRYHDCGGRRPNPRHVSSIQTLRRKPFDPAFKVEPTEPGSARQNATCDTGDSPHGTHGKRCSDSFPSLGMPRDAQRSLVFAEVFIDEVLVIRGTSFVGIEARQVLLA